ncbi:MAG: hypothetical protein JSU65_07175, partial [Candidatus Zixiibacteriota bacterium]
MRIALAILISVLTSANVHAQNFDPYEGPEPAAVLIQTDPWRAAPGSGLMVAIYNDGQVILRKEKDQEYMFLHSQLRPGALTDVKKKLHTFGDYSELEHRYDLAPFVTDQPTIYIYLSLDDTTFVTSVYGLRVSDTGLQAFTGFSFDQKPDELPRTIRELLGYLTSLDFADANPWVPPFVEIMIWDYGYAPYESVQWPVDWPSLSSPYTLRRT